MTNAEIITRTSIDLMKRGLLKSTGRKIVVEYENGKKEFDEPEPIHTFNGWKERGYQVKKGEHSTIKFPIWKYTVKQKKEEEKTGNPLEDEPTTNMFMKLSAFFTMEQVEPIK